MDSLAALLPRCRSENEIDAKSQTKSELRSTLMNEITCDCDRESTSQVAERLSG